MKKAIALWVLVWVLGVLFILTPKAHSADVGKALTVVFGHEGGLQCDKNDPGNRRPNGTYGCTKYGIASSSYPNVDIRKLTLKGAAKIYKRDYWTPLMLDGVKSQGLATEIFDTAVNCGVGTSALIVTRACSFIGGGLHVLPVSKSLSMQHIQWINTYTRSRPNRVVFYKVLNVLQGQRYLTIAESNPKMRRYLNGWFNRIGV